MSTLLVPATPSRRRRHTAGCVVLVLALAACTSSREADDDPGGGTTSAPASLPSTAAPPGTTDDEVARSVHSAEGADGVPRTADTVSGAVGDDTPLRVEGACTGERASMPFTVSTAAAGQEQETLVEGSITCGVGVERDGVDSRPTYEGPVQVSIVGTDELDSGWVRLLAG